MRGAGGVWDCVICACAEGEVRSRDRERTKRGVAEVAERIAEQLQRTGWEIRMDRRLLVIAVR